MDVAERTVTVKVVARPWQRPLVQAFRNGIRHACVVAHRRAGKDRAALFIELERALQQRCEVWHALPEQEQARKVIWDGITKDGERLIEVAFPPGIVKRRNDSEMKIELVNGSLWRLVGADRFNSLVGANPRHVTLSEFAITNPQAREFIRPILAENGGSELLITTPRGYNHAFEVLQSAQSSPLWYTAIHPVSQTRLIPEEELAEARRTMPDELYRQEYECDFSAANVGSVLGRYLEAAGREGRLDTEDAHYDPDGLDVDVSSDIGYRDAAAFWFWQRRADGYALVDYVEGSGLDADDWIERLRAYPYPLGTVWLPHDARVKTFQSKRSSVEAFASAGLARRVRIVPQAKIADRVNAARVIMRRCRFSPQVAAGVTVLRAWSFDYDNERKTFSPEPRHDWASHGADGFSYGAQVMMEEAKSQPAPSALPLVAAQSFSLDQLHGDRERGEL